MTEREKNNNVFTVYNSHHYVCIITVSIIIIAAVLIQFNLMFYFN